MAKILVADDNSNVQKTVTLALADLGIEVVAVNNGEAAVRKLADFSPDLVLADIFMPVRNGYEVCEYVKKDSRFTQVPVVLLVGAFDPLDEREAQRVGADGILKKPFVPTEPLITMVKALLDRGSGEQLVAVSVGKPAIAVPVKVNAPAIAKERPPVPKAPVNPPTQEFMPPPGAGRVTFGEGAHPVAFGQLLEVPAQDAIEPATGVIEPVDNDQVLTSSRDANLGDPIFWRNEPSEPEPSADSPNEASADISVRPWTPDEESLPRREEAVLLQPIEPLELIREEPDQNSETAVEPETISVDPAVQAPLTVESGKAPELADNPIEWMATVPPQQVQEEPDLSPDWDEPIQETTNTIEAEPPELAEAVRPVSLPVSEEGAASPAVSVATHAEATHLETGISREAPDSSQAQALTESVEQILVDAAQHIASEHPETKSVITPEPSKTQPSLRPLEERPESTPRAIVSGQLETKPAGPTQELGKTHTPLLAQSPDDTARSIPKQDWADLAAALQPVEELVPEQKKALTEPIVATPTVAVAAGNSELPAEAPAAVSAPDAALVEAVVQRVLEKMRPQVVEIITKEFLRPIVQALVYREIEKR